MANRQLEAFGEPFTSEMAINRFKSKDFSCPFDKRISLCDKPNSSSQKYGNCSVEVGQGKRIICPRRYYEYNYKILQDVKEFIWINDGKIACYDEFTIKITNKDGDTFNYGNLDWILIKNNDFSDFCGVEIQSDATTGTGVFSKGIEDLLENRLKKSYNFGLNTLASFKGFLPQFIFKGQLFDDWKKPYIAIMQDELFNKFITKFRIRYKEITRYTTETFIIFTYSLKLNPTTNKYELSDRKIYSTRWIDLLFSFSVENELLIDIDNIINKIKDKTEKKGPIVVF